MGKHLAFNAKPERPWQAAECPPDFAETFIQEGWSGIRAKYGFHTRTEKRFIEQAGGNELRQRRAEFLRDRVRSRQSKPDPATPPAPPEPGRDALAAISFLRSPEGGGWAITATGEGDFYFGCTRMSGRDILGRANRARLKLGLIQPASE